MGFTNFGSPYRDGVGVRGRHGAHGASRMVCTSCTSLDWEQARVDAAQDRCPGERVSAAALPRAIYDGDMALSHHATVELQDGHGAAHGQRRLGESGSVARVG